MWANISLSSIFVYRFIVPGQNTLDCEEMDSAILTQVATMSAVSYVVEALVGLRVSPNSTGIQTIADENMVGCFGCRLLFKLSLPPYNRIGLVHASMAFTPWLRRL